MTDAIKNGDCVQHVSTLEWGTVCDASQPDELSVQFGGHRRSWWPRMAIVAHKPGAWEEFIPPEVPACDYCTSPAKWKHPLGGMRCGRCPRPE